MQLQGHDSILQGMHKLQVEQLCTECAWLVASLGGIARAVIGVSGAIRGPGAVQGNRSGTIRLPRAALGEVDMACGVWCLCMCAIRGGRRPHSLLCKVCADRECGGLDIAAPYVWSFVKAPNTCTKQQTLRRPV